MEPSPNPKEITSRYEKLLVALVTAGIDFAVVGGLAVIFNGYPRTTVDADILVSDSAENLRKLLECLRSSGTQFTKVITLGRLPLFRQPLLPLLVEFISVRFSHRHERCDVFDNRWIFVKMDFVDDVFHRSIAPLKTLLREQ
jgi:hypothetical protein